MKRIPLKATELGLGNVVQRPKKFRIPMIDNGQIYYGITPSMLFDCHMLKEHWAFEGAPITQKILLKLGFKKIVTKLNRGLKWIDYRFDNMVVRLVQKSLEIEVAPSFCDIEERSYFCTIKYLHQLQNIYFDWTVGKELDTTKIR